MALIDMLKRLLDLRRNICLERNVVVPRRLAIWGIEELDLFARISPVHYGVLDSNFRKVRLLIFIQSLLPSLRNKQGIRFNYILTQVKELQCSLIVSFNDIDPVLYRLRAVMDGLTVVTVQRANRREEHFASLVHAFSGKRAKVDYSLCLGERHVEFYQQFVDSEKKAIGSLALLAFSAAKCDLTRESLKSDLDKRFTNFIFISDFRPGYALSHPHIAGMVSVFSNLQKFKFRSEISITIGLALDGEFGEREFFSGLLTELGIKNFKMINFGGGECYRLVDFDALVLGCRSTLNYEFMSSGIRTAIFPSVVYPWLDKSDLGGEYIAANGTFSEFERVLSNLLNSNLDLYWEKTRRLSEKYCKPGYSGLDYITKLLVDCGIKPDIR